MTNSYISAKRIFDFYLTKLSEDVTSRDAQFAQQYAHLKLLRYKTNGIKNSLESYTIVTN